MSKTDGNYADFQYDANGNRIAKVGNNYNTTYGYDYENRLTRIDEHNGKALEYAYDGDGNRISRSDLQPTPNGLEIAQYLYDINNSLPEATEENTGLEVQNAEQPKDSEQPEEEITNKSYMDKVESTIRLLNTNADNRELVQEPKVPVMDVPFKIQTQQPQMLAPTLPENLKADNVKPRTNNNLESKESTKEPLIKIPTISENIKVDTANSGTNNTNNKLNSILNLTPKLPDNPLKDTINPNLNKNLSQVIAVYNGKTGALDADYSYGLERISVHDEDTSTGKVQDPLYYLYDGMGRVTELTTPTAQVSDKYRFDPFGVELPGGKMSPNAYKNLNNPFGYNGEQYDPEAGLSYMRNRYYEPETGRFINRDLLPGRVAEPLSMNAYAFVGNNPLEYEDPLGLEKGKRRPRINGVEVDNPLDLLRPRVEVPEGAGKSKFKIPDGVAIMDWATNKFANIWDSTIYAILNPMDYATNNFANSLDSVYYGAKNFKKDPLGSMSDIGNGILGIALSVDEPFLGGVEKGVIKGTFKGSLNGLTKSEQTVVNDLLSQGKNVEIIPRTTALKTPDFLVNGVKTELKSLENPNINTGITRIQKGFKQGAETVIIDGRQAGLTTEQANEILNRAAGTYKDKVLPGQVEIWTNDGVIRR